MPAVLEEDGLEEVGRISGATGKNKTEQIRGRTSLCAARTTASIVQVRVVTWDSGGRGRDPVSKQHFMSTTPVVPPEFPNCVGLGPSRDEGSWAVPSWDISGDHLGGRGQGERAGIPPELPPAAEPGGC